MGFYRSDGGAERGTPDIDRREEKRIKIYGRECTGSALVPKWVGVSAELGSAEMSMLVTLLVLRDSAARVMRGRSIPARPPHPRPVSPCGFSAYLPRPWDSF